MKRLFFLLVVLMLAGCAGFGPRPPAPGDGVLTLVNQRTGERATVRFREGGFLIPPAMAQINYLMRDVRTGMVGQIDPNLIVYLDDLTGAMGLPGDVPVVVTSGYRSPMTNHALRAKSGQVAENSHHMSGRALDFKIPGVAACALSRMALRMRRGGAACYISSDHVHIDTGPVRTWRTN